MILRYILLCATFLAQSPALMAQADRVPKSFSSSEADEAASRAMAAADEAAKAIDGVPVPPYWTDGQWKVVRGRSVCSMQAREPLVIEYDARRQEIALSFFAPGATSLRTGVKYNIRIAFIIKKPMSGIYYPHTPQFSAPYDGVGYLRGTDRASIAEYLTKYDMIAFYTDKDILISSFALAGFSQAFPHLSECAQKERVVNPSDPFADGR